MWHFLAIWSTNVSIVSWLTIYLSHILERVLFWSKFFTMFLELKIVLKLQKSSGSLLFTMWWIKGRVQVLLDPKFALSPFCIEAPSSISVYGTFLRTIWNTCDPTPANESLCSKIQFLISHAKSLIYLCWVKCLWGFLENKAVLEPRVSPAFAITYFCNHCNI